MITQEQLLLSENSEKLFLMPKEKIKTLNQNFLLNNLKKLLWTKKNKKMNILDVLEIQRKKLSAARTHYLFYLKKIDNKTFYQQKLSKTSRNNQSLRKLR